MALYDTYIKQQRARFTRELVQFCGQRSLSSTGEGIEMMAMMVADRLSRLGARTRQLTVGGSYPYVVADIGEGPRTLLLYNHYDVQPAHHDDGWTHDPFEPTISDGRLFARGVADNKANLLFRIQAIEAYLAIRQQLPVRVRFLIEGEEEIGSPHLGSFIAQHTDLVRADGCLWESGRKGIEGRPLLQLGLRGILYVELSLHAPNREIHSSWANIVQNPAMALLERLQQAVQSLTDSEERPTFGGLLDDAPRPTAIDKAMLDAIPFDLPTFEEKLGAQVRNGLAPGEALYRLFFEPTCTICGLSVGYSGPGTKTAIPNHAVAKLDMRLPPGLVPDDVEHRLREHLQAHGFGDILVRRLGAVRPSRTPPEAAIVRATREAVRTVYGVDPVVHPLMTASGPMYELCEAHGVPAVTFGAGHASDNVHGIDENICLDDYFQAMRAMGEIVRRFGSVER